MDINDVVKEYCLYDEYVICKEGWYVEALNQIDTDMGKQMTEWEIKLYCSSTDTHWEGRFWNSYYNGVRDGWRLYRYTPEEEEEEMVDLDELGEDVYEYLTSLRSVIKELIDEIEGSIIVINCESDDIKCVEMDDNIENRIKKVKEILENK